MQMWRRALREGAWRGLAAGLLVATTLLTAESAYEPDAFAKGRATAPAKAKRPKPTKAAPTAEANVEAVNETAPNPYALPDKPGPEDLRSLHETCHRLAREGRWAELAQAAQAMLARREGRAYGAEAAFYAAYADAKRGKTALETTAVRAANAYPELAAELRFLMAEAAREGGDTEQARQLYQRVFTPPHDATPRQTELLAAHPLSLPARLRSLEARLTPAQAHALTIELKNLQDSFSKEPENAPECLDDFRFLAARAQALSGRPQAEAAFLTTIISPHPACLFAREMGERRAEFVRDGRIAPPALSEDALWRLKTLLANLYHEEALALAERVERAAPANHPLLPELRYQKARALFALQRYEEALALYRSLPSLFAADDKRKVDCLHGEARTLARLNRLAEAANAYTRLAESDETPALRLQAEFLQAWLLGFVPAERGQADARLAAFEDAHPRHALARKARWFRAFFRYLAGDGENAYAQFKSIVPDHAMRDYAPAARYWSARLLQSWGRLNEAQALYLFLAGDDDVTYYRLAATERLEAMIAQKAAPTGDGLTPAPVDDAEVNGAVEARLAAFRRERDSRLAFVREATSGERVRQSLRSTAATWSEEAARDDARGVRLGKLADLWKDVFPDIKTARAFTSLDLPEEAGHVLERFWSGFQPLLKRRTPKKARHGKAADDLASARAEALRKAPPTFLADLAAWAEQVGDIALGYQIMTHGMSPAARIAYKADRGEQRQYPPAYVEAVMRHAEAAQIPAELVYAIMRTESTYRPDVVSPAQAVGLMQIMPHTFDRLAAMQSLAHASRHDLYDASLNIRLGAAYLARLGEGFQGHWPLAIAAYNAGPFNVETWMKRTGRVETDVFVETLEFDQTRAYVKKVLRTLAAYRALYDGAYTAPSVLAIIPDSLAPNAIRF